jgi:hypothetical protein
MRFRTIITIGAVALLAVSVGAVGTALGAKTTAVEVSPSNQTLEPNETTTVDVVVTNATDGVGSYEFDLNLSDASVATIKSVSLKGNPIQGGSKTIASDGSSVHVSGSVADTADSGEVSVVTVTVEGKAGGSTDLNLNVDTMGDELGEAYTISSVGNGTLTVEEPTVSAKLAPASAKAVSNSTRVMDVIVGNASNGIGTYNLSVGINDTTAATIADATPKGDPIQDGSTTIAEDGSSVTIVGTAASLNGSGGVTIATVTLETLSAGSTSVSMSVSQLGDIVGNSYPNIGSSTGATLKVRPQPSEPVSDDFEKPSSDTDGDGTLDDVNGDGVCNVNDVTALWGNRDSNVIDTNSDLYDMNNDGVFNLNDVTALWSLYLNGDC